MFQPVEHRAQKILLNMLQGYDILLSIRLSFSSLVPSILTYAGESLYLHHRVNLERGKIRDFASPKPPLVAFGFLFDTQDPGCSPLHHLSANPLRLFVAILTRLLAPTKVQRLNKEAGRKYFIEVL